MKPNLQGGQLLVEVLVALALALIVATAFVSLGVVAVRNSQASKNQANATQLAQEGIEKVIQMRDSGSGVWTTFVTNPSTSTCTQTNVVDPTASCLNDYMLTSGGDIQGCQNTCEQISVNGSNTTYYRKLRVVNSTSNLIDLIVLVWWTDSSGAHTSQLERLISKDRFQ